MGKISNFFIFFCTLCVLTVIIITRTTMKITEHHEEKLLYAMETKIQINAKRCYLENKCSGEVTLDHLYKNKYLDEVVNPVTKEILDTNIKINYVDNKIIIDWNKNAS